MIIDKKIGVIRDGVNYYSVGEGSRNIESTGYRLFGYASFHTLTTLAILGGYCGAHKNMQYYLTEDQVDVWNKYHLNEKAKQLTPEGATFLGEGGEFTLDINGETEFGVIDFHGVWQAEVDLGWHKRDCNKTHENFFYYSRPVKKADPLMDTAIELAVGDIEIVGYGQPEGLEFKEDYEISWIKKGLIGLPKYWDTWKYGGHENVIYFQRPIKKESKPVIQDEPMKFVFGETNTKEIPRFGDVLDNQFFVDEAGCLHQKLYSHSANQLTRSDGTPNSSQDTFFDPEDRIERILPHVNKIKY